MLDKEALRKQAIADCERELTSLNDFTKEGHPNNDVFLAVVNRIGAVEKMLKELQGENSTNF